MRWMKFDGSGGAVGTRMALVGERGAWMDGMEEGRGEEGDQMGLGMRCAAG